MANPPESRTTPPPRLDQQLLSDLYIFEQVASAAGMGAAARRIGVSQGAVSQRIARLEARLGMTLFARSPQGLTLTPRGAQLAAAVEDSIRTLRQALSEVRPTEAVRVRVNCTPSLASDWLVPALDDFYAAYPDLDVVVHADQATMTPARMAGEAIDVAIRYAPEPLAGFLEIGALPEGVAPVRAPSYPAKPDAPITRFHDETPWIGAGADEEWSRWEAAGEPLAHPIARDQGFNLASLAYEAAAAGRGVAMGRLALVRHRLVAGQLVAASSREAHGAAYRLVSIRAHPPRSAASRFARWMLKRLAADQQAARELITSSAKS